MQKTKLRREHSTIYDDIIFLKVGPSQTRFGIHRGLLTKASGFFRDVLMPNLNKATAKNVMVTHEGDSTIILLVDKNADTVARVNHWFYSGKMLKPDESWADVKWEHLISVYLFSVEMRIARLHNKCIDAAIVKTKDGGLFPSQTTINALYRLDAQTWPLRKLFIKLFAVRCDLRSAMLQNSSYHQSFLNWLIIELYQMQEDDVRGKDVNVWKTREEYYVHGSDNPISVD